MRRSREGVFSDRERDRALIGLEKDMSAMLIVELTPEVAARARRLLERQPLRAGDAIQLASCLYLREELGEDVQFVAFDKRLAAAASQEGLTVA